MSEHEDEREVERLYRQLPREEPPAALDAKIRAEARRAVIVHPAPLVAPTGRRHWYFPVAAAAVIVLAVAVTWQVERAQPDPAASDELLYKRTEESAPAPSPQAPEAFNEKSSPPRVRRDAAPKAVREQPQLREESPPRSDASPQDKPAEVSPQEKPAEPV